MTLLGLGVVLLCLTGVVLIAINARKLISDWPRMKPRHNVDLAWIQVYLGVALLVIAWFVGTNPAHQLMEDTPTPVNPEAAAQAESRPKK